jgi:hypothetical protein
VLTLAECFCKAMAWQEMRSVDNITDVSGSWRYVALAMSNGSMG